MSTVLPESSAGPLPPPPGLEGLLDLAVLEAPAEGREAILTVLQSGLKSINQGLEARFRQGEPVVNLVHARARAVERLLLFAWRRLGADDELALVAVGGFGRGELHPHSDIDLLVLFGGAELTPPQKAAVEAFVTLLWDAGFYLGHAVRNLAQCREEIAADVSTTTSLMEARLLAGPEAMFHDLERLVSADDPWTPAAFFHAKEKEQTARHAQYGETAYNLEPNIKEGPGGLRDIQTIDWVARRHFKASDMHALVDHGFLTDADHRKLVDGQHYLWRVRYALHLLAGRAEDRLLFDFQRQVAEMFGFRDDGRPNQAVERFMQGYYQVITRLERINERLLNLFREELLGDDAVASENLGNGFRVLHGYLDVVDDRVFRRRPAAIMEMFTLLAQRDDLLGVRASTIRLLVEHLYLIDDAFRADPRVLASFMELLRQPRGVYTQLQRMNRYVVLANFIPAFGSIVGRMQFDLFHVYTVDQHILFTVRNLRRFAYGKYADQFPHSQKVFRQIPKPEVLYLAALFHDIAKGRGGDHSELGAEEARAFCARLPMRESDRELVAWLVEHHLVMSQTAQKKDITDPETVRRFAELVKTRERLDHLYLLTVADISATSPRLWNHWKSGLLWELHQGTHGLLKQDPDQPLDRAGAMTQTREEALLRLQAQGIDRARIENFWSQLPAYTFLRFSTGQLAWSTREALEYPRGAHIAVRRREDRGISEVLVIAPDYTGLFATITSVLDELGLDVLSARVVTSTDGRSFDLFQVMDRQGKPLNEVDTETLVARLRAPIAEQRVQDPMVRPLPRRLRPFITPPTISFRSARGGQVTEMEIECTDRPGLLSQLSAAMVQCGVSIQDAMIGTFGDRVEDVFLVTGRDEQPLPEALQKQLSEAITERLQR